MPSLRKRVSSYFRQLSFHNEPRERRLNINENTFVTKYLQGQISLREGPPIIHGKTPTDLPNYELGLYDLGAGSIISCYTGPNGGLTTVRRKEKHLSVLDQDIDFIDTANQEEKVVAIPRKSPIHIRGQPVDNTTMVIKVAGQEYCVTNRMKKRHSKSHSLGSISDFDLEIETTKIDKEFYNNPNHHHHQIVDDDINCSQTNNDNNNSDKVLCKNSTTSTTTNTANTNDRKKSTSSPTKEQKKSAQKNYSLAKSKSEGNPFRHERKGKIIRVAQRPNTARGDEAAGAPDAPPYITDDSTLPTEWSRKSNLVYGISDSLYDRNQVTSCKNGDPIADCFGVITRRDSAILAVADGVNWGEKACLAAKSAVHGSLHYLSRTIFNDTKPFESITDMVGSPADPTIALNHRIKDTREIFVCLLRAFNCAHDLILENKGMLTTLTVAIVLPLKRKSVNNGSEPAHSHGDFVCCVCNVGDTLAYVYSPKHGLRELTKGSHDINCNRDMRDALGALGPVDGINPELSNLTLSVTVLDKGDIVMLASDGLTDNFDPNVCKFSVNSRLVNSNESVKGRRPNTALPTVAPSSSNSSSTKTEPAPAEAGSVVPTQPPVKPPRKAHLNRPNVTETKSSSLRRQASNQRRDPTSHNHKLSSSSTTSTAPSSSSSSNYKFLRSKTSLEMRHNQMYHKRILRNEDGMPFVTPLQRYELQLLLIEDILKRGISGKESNCKTAKELCESLVSFTFSITAAKRRTLEDQDLYFDNRNGVLVEVSQQEKKNRRKRGLEKVQNLPGKLDHVTVVAWNVANFQFNI